MAELLSLFDEYNDDITGCAFTRKAPWIRVPAFFLISFTIRKKKSGIRYTEELKYHDIHIQMQKLHSVSTFVRNNSYVWEKALSLARALGLSTLSPDETGTHLSARTASSLLGEIPQQPLHHFSKVFYSCDCTRNSI